MVRFILEGGVDILQWAMIALIYGRSHGFGAKPIDKFSNILAIILLVALLIAPIHTIYRAYNLYRHSQVQTDNMPDPEKKAHEEKLEQMRTLF